MIERLRQIIEYYGLTTRQFEQKIFASSGQIYKYLSRGGGLNSDTLIKILENCQQISPDWLLLGRGKMLRQNDANLHQNEPKNDPFEGKNVKNIEKRNISSYETNLEGSQNKAAEGNDGWNAVTIADLQRENDRLWERYDEAQQLVGSLRAELKAVKEQAAGYAKEKTEPFGTTTQVEG
jgi:hypothetical protein